MITIDEAIAHAREVAKKNREICRLKTIENAPSIFKWAKEHEQLAEWLEELKELRKIKEDYAKGMQTSYATFMYNKAIDDFAKSIIDTVNDFPTVENEDGEIRPMRIEEMCKNISEQLKAGETS